MAARKQAKSGSSSPARTIVYIHGIGNKPTEDVLRCQWDRALMGFGLGERSRMAYWCQSERHGPPSPDTCQDADAIAARSDRGGRIAARAMQDERPVGEWAASLAADDTPAQRRTLERLAERLNTPARPPRVPRARRVEAQGLGDEWNAPDWLTRLTTKLFLVDVRDFFFDAARREAMKLSLRRRIETGGGPFVVVAHSQGSMVAYTVLHELGAQADVSLFLTIGSPLGLEEVRDQLSKQGLTRDRDRLTIPAGVRRWVNVRDRKDVVAQDVDLAQFYRAEPGSMLAIEDLTLDNPDRPRDPHSATGYLSLPDVRARVRDRIDLERFQRVSPFMLAADVVVDYEQRGDAERRPLLIELSDPTWALRQRQSAEAQGRAPRAKAPEELSLAQMADALTAEVRRVAGPRVPAEALRVQRLRRYLSVHLTRAEAEKLAQAPALTKLGLTVPPLYRIWRNAKKRALLQDSIHTVQASAAHQAYAALGGGIEWAVLDSGCTPHAHFEQHHNIVARWDCTLDSDAPLRDGTPGRSGRRKRIADSRDAFGHGTHVAGIIAGAYQHAKAGWHVSGIAPQAKLHIYKVLDDEGVGDDAWIIKAIDHIASVNERAGAPVIAGVNLSLGGPYEQGVFGCGFSPLCDELRRLWQQGVVVVLAAGNEGHVTLMSSDGEMEANLPYTIGDPANLEVAIAVGSIHRSKPHTYGVSHFSSRGPTVDGRAKPDCVAPGEQILSCRHDPRARPQQPSDLYYRLDGTSMAAPHVSGVLAAFLSRRREFIGQPDQVKRILLEQCTDLGRERQQQGAGMPNLVRMLVQT